jgi:hypothetical protein
MANRYSPRWTRQTVGGRRVGHSPATVALPQHQGSRLRRGGRERQKSGTPGTPAGRPSGTMGKGQGQAGTPLDTRGDTRAGWGTEAGGPLAAVGAAAGGALPPALPPAIIDSSQMPFSTVFATLPVGDLGSSVARHPGSSPGSRNPLSFEALFWKSGFARLLPDRSVPRPIVTRLSADRFGGCHLQGVTIKVWFRGIGIEQAVQRWRGAALDQQSTSGRNE